MKRRKFFNMYLTTTVSVTLVLFLVAVETAIILSARDIMTHIRESVSMTVVVSDDADSSQVARLETLLSSSAYTKQYVYISKQQALDDHIAALGENPQDFLGFNPLKASYELSLNADYAQADSIAMIEESLKAMSAVDRVVYQKDVVSMLDDNLQSISLILLAIALALLLVAVALMLNTIRLYIYSKRFLIKTMQLVGATSAFIKRPIIARNLLMGFIASVLALIVTFCALYYCQMNMGVSLMLLNWQNILILSGVVIGVGLLITLLSSVIATNHFIRMKTDDLYYV